MKFAFYKTDGTSELLETDTPIGLEKLQELVAGSIEGYRTVAGDFVYINEEGRLDNLPKNPFFGEDLRGNVVVTGGTDDEGNDIGLPDDYQLKTITAWPKEMFVKGNKFTVFFIGSSWGSTGRIEVTSKGFEYAGLPAFSEKGKRKEFVMRAADPSESLYFQGWDLPIKAECEIQQTDTGHTYGVIRMNSMLNLGGCSIETIKDFVDNRNINPFFIAKDRVNYIDGKGEGVLVYPNFPTSSKRIAERQSAQLKDGKFRIVV